MISRKDVDEALIDAFRDALKARFANIAADQTNDTKVVANRLHNAMQELKHTYDLACQVADGIFT